MKKIKFFRIIFMMMIMGLAFVGCDTGNGGGGGDGYNIRLLAGNIQDKLPDEQYIQSRIIVEFDEDMFGEMDFTMEETIDGIDIGGSYQKEGRDFMLGIWPDTIIVGQEYEVRLVWNFDDKDPLVIEKTLTAEELTEDDL
jgi:hypothetical protein